MNYIKLMISMLIFMLPLTTESAEQMRAHFIDVGQGDATMLEFPCATVLIDVGSELNLGFDGSFKLLDYLTTFFNTNSHLKNTIDLLVLAHPHIDHTRTVRRVVGYYDVKQILGFC